MIGDEEAESTEYADNASDNKGTDATTDSDTITETTGCDETTTDSTSLITTDRTSEIATDRAASGNELGRGFHLTPEEILNLCGQRHIRAEDPDWATCPVPKLSDIIIRSTKYAKGPDVEKLLTNANNEQQLRIKELLPLNLHLKYTLPLPDMEVYWKRQYLDRWSANETWKYNDSWKKMFIERFVQDLVENFIPSESDKRELEESLNTFKRYEFRLQIRKLQKSEKESFQVDLREENFDDLLDEFIAAPEIEPSFLNFEAVLENLPELSGFSLILTPSSLDCEIFQLSDVDFNSLLKGLRKVRKLKEFRVSNGVLTDQQITVLCRLFHRYDKLTSLDLSFNFIKDECCDYLAKLLLSPDCPLESLILKYNRIGNEGAISIAAALSRNSTLKRLDLSLNWIEDEGGKFLADVVSGSENIEYLDVSQNKLGNGAGVAFAECVRKVKCLRKLNLAENNLGQEAGAALKEAVKDNETILCLGIQFCGLLSKDEDDIHRVISRNRSSVTYAAYKNDFASEFII